MNASALPAEPSSAEEFLGAEAGLPPMLPEDSAGADTFIPESAVDFIKQREGFVPRATWDVRQWSVGYGTRGREGEVLTQADADKRLRAELRGHAERVDAAARLHGVELNENQRAALVSFDFNSGRGGKVIERLKRDGENSALGYMASILSPDPRYREGLAKRRIDEIRLWRKPVAARDAEEFLGGPVDAIDFVSSGEERERDARIDAAGAVKIDKGAARTFDLAGVPLPGVEPARDMSVRPAGIAEEALVVKGLRDLETALLSASLNVTGDSGIAPDTSHQEAAVTAELTRLRGLGMTDEEIIRRKNDLAALTPARSARASDGRIIVNPELAFDEKEWLAAAREVGAAGDALERAREDRLALRDYLAEELEPIAQKSGAYLDWLDKQAAGAGVQPHELYQRMTSGDLLEKFYAETGSGLGNLGAQTKGAVSGAVSRTGQGIFGLLDMLVYANRGGVSTYHGPGASQEASLFKDLADTARMDADETARVRDAIGGGWWAKRIANLAGAAVGSAPMFLGAPAGLVGVASAAGALQGGQTYNDALAAGYTPGEAAALAAASGLAEGGITAAFGKTGIESVLAPATGATLGRRIIGGALAELPEELSQTAAQIPIRQAINPADMPTAEEWLDTAIGAAALGGGLNAAHRPPSVRASAPDADTTQPVNLADVDLSEGIDPAAAAATFGAPASGAKTAPVSTPPAPLPEVTPQLREHLAREYSVPRGMVDGIAAEDAAALLATAPGSAPAIAIVSSLISRRRATAGPPSAATPPAASAAAAAAAVPSPATENVPAESEDAIAIRESAKIAADVDLLRRLRSKDAEVRARAGRQLLQRDGINEGTTNGYEGRIEHLTNQLDEQLTYAESDAAERDAINSAEDDLTVVETPATEDMPFSMQAFHGTPHEQAGRMHGTVSPAASLAEARRTLAALGIAEDMVNVVADVASIADATARKHAMAGAARGNRIEGFYQGGKVTLVAAGLPSVARAREVVLHEVVGHHGLAALFSKSPAAWQRTVDSLHRRLGSQLDYIAKLYGYDPKTAAGRSSIIEEHLARLAEADKRPSWFSSIVGQIKDLLRKLSGGRLFKDFTDADVIRLLAKARSAARTGSAGARTANLKFSQQSDEEAVVRALVADKDSLRTSKTQHKLKSKDSPLADPVKSALNGVFAEWTNADATRQGAEWVARDGADAVERALLAAERLTPRDLAAMPLVARELSAAGLYEREAALWRKLRDSNTDAGQQIQAMKLLYGLLGMASPEGAVRMVRGDVDAATQARLDELSKKNAELAAELKAAQKLVEDMQATIEKHVTTPATSPASAVVIEAKGIIESLVKEAAKLAPERLTELNVKVRDALMRDDGTDTTVSRVRGLLIAAGADRMRAAKLAESLVAKFRKKRQAAVTKLLKAMMKLPAVTAKIPKGQIAKWNALLDTGALDDDALLPKLAEKFGFAVFTRADAAKVKAMQSRYAAAPDGIAKLIAGSEFLEWVADKTHRAGLWDHVRAWSKMLPLLGFKVMFRNVISNTASQIAETAVDVGRWLPQRVFGVMTGGKGVPAGMALARWKGYGETWRVAKAGAAYAKAEGRSAIKGAVEALLVAARYHTRGITDAASVRDVYRRTFRGGFGRMVENAVTFMTSSTDLPRYYGGVRAQLARLMHEQGAKIPTPDMIEDANTLAARDNYQDDNLISRALRGAEKALNFGKPWGLGTGIIRYAQVPGSIFNQLLDWTPAGFLKALYHTGRAATSTGRARSMAAEMAWNRGVKATMGLATLQLGAYLWKLGVLVMLDDDDREQRAVLEANGIRTGLNWTEFQRRLSSGDWFSKSRGPHPNDQIAGFSWVQPLATLLVMGAEAARGTAIAAQKRALGRLPDDEPGGLLARATDIAKAGIGAFTSHPMMMGLSRIVQSFDRGLRPDGTLWDFAAPGLQVLDFTPSILGDVQAFTDNQLYETRGGNPVMTELERIVSRWPGGAKALGLTPAVTAYGEPRTRWPENQNGWVNVFLNPFLGAKVRDNRVAAEADRLWRATGTGTAPNLAERKITISPTALPGDAETFALSDAELAAWQRTHGRLVWLAQSARMADKEFWKLSNEQRAALFARDVAAAHKAARIVLFGDSLVELTTNGLSKNLRAIAMANTARELGAVQLREPKRKGRLPIPSRP